MNKFIVSLCIAMTATLIGCGDDSGTNDGPLTDAEKMEQRAELLAAADDYSFDNPPPTPKGNCDITLEAGSDPAGDASMFNTAVEDASSFDIICVSPGTYDMDNAVTISAAQNLMIKGIGDGPDDVVLDFANQTTGRGIDVTTPGFWIENMTIKNTQDNGVEVKANNTAALPNVFRKLKVFWDIAADANPLDCAADDPMTPELEGDPRRGHGAYSVYPTKSTYAVVEFCDVEGASDAGLYVGQVEGGIVRHNSVHGNVAGLEVENSKDVVVYGNDVYDNSGGILALQEPDLDRLANENVLIRDNIARDNNGCNFARANTTVSNIPPGTGMMSFAGNGVEFRDNTATGNISTGLLLVSNVVLDFLSGNTNPMYPMGYNPYVINVMMTGNTFSNNGTDPQAALAAFAPPSGILEDVLWDGITDSGVTDADAMICLGSSDAPSFRNLDAENFPTSTSTTDTTDHECTIAAIDLGTSF